MIIVTYEQGNVKKTEMFRDRYKIYHLIWDNQYNTPVIITGIWEVE